MLPVNYWLFLPACCIDVLLQGLVDAVGLSNYGPQQLAKIGAYLQKKGVPLAAVQVQYSLLRCGVEVTAASAGPAAQQHTMVPYARSNMTLGCQPCPLPHLHFACSRGPEQASVKAACDDLGVTLIAYSPLALGVSLPRPCHLCVAVRASAKQQSNLRYRQALPSHVIFRHCAGGHTEPTSHIACLSLPGMLTGKYSMDDPSSLPSGPRGLVFRRA